MNLMNWFFIFYLQITFCCFSKVKEASKFLFIYMFIYLFFFKLPFLRPNIYDMLSHLFGFNSFIQNLRRCLVICGRYQLAEIIPGLRPWEVLSVEQAMDQITYDGEWYREPLGTYTRGPPYIRNWNKDVMV